jgi:hypothetical protein
MILVMDHINDHFTAQANDKTYSPAIRAALALQKKKTSIDTTVPF